MSRPKRRFTADVPHHVISRGNGRMKIFHDPSDYGTYVRLLQRYKKEFSVKVFHYVVMPNHVHLLLRPGTPTGSKFMQRLNMEYSRYYCRKYGKIAHVWKNRFQNKEIEDDAYLLSCGNYIEMNPVRAGIVRTAGNWPHSSYNHYAKGERDPIVDTDPTYRSFGKTPLARQKAYSAFIGKTRSF